MPLLPRPGREPFERPRASAKFSESNTLADADAAANDRLNSLGPATESPPATRRVRGRLFVQRGQVWTDIAHADRITITEVERYSVAYFELVRQLPELVPYLSAGDKVLVAGKHCSLRFSHTGIRAWHPRQLVTLVRNFRGT